MEGENPSMSLWDRLVVQVLPFVPRPLVGRFARPYIAGETMEQALDVVRGLNAEGAMTTLDILGEGVHERRHAIRARDDYLRLLQEIASQRLDANVSVKLTQLGLALDRSFCLENIRSVVARAAELDNFIRIDMEDSGVTGPTLEIHNALHGAFPARVGVAIQAYLRRSRTDVEELAAMKANIRLCKGIYVEPFEIAFKDRSLVQRNFIDLLERLLDAGSYVGIATHDEIVVQDARRAIRRRGLPRERYEFQMLLGVTVPLRRLLLREGHRLRVYVPYGPNWHAYSVRRLRENPRLAGDLARKTLGFGSDGRG
jgi:proline dehydrogenase